MADLAKFNSLTPPVGAGDPTLNDIINIDVNVTISGTPGTTWTSIYSHTVSGYDYGALYWLKNDYTTASSVYYYYYLQILVDGSVVYNSFTDEIDTATGRIQPEAVGINYVAVGKDCHTLVFQPVTFTTSLELKASPYWSTGTRYAWAFGYFDKY
jgi:hypothetical protein